MMIDAVMYGMMPSAKMANGVKRTAREQLNVRKDSTLRSLVSRSCCTASCQSPAPG